MDEQELLSKVKGKRSILSRIQDFFLFGYGTKEDLRELDKKLRDNYYSDLRNLRHTWEDVYFEVLDKGIKASNRDLKKIIQVLDRVIEKIHHADYGYAGLFDRKGHIQEQELARVLNFDMTFSTKITDLTEAIIKTQRDIEAENSADIQEDVKNIKTVLYALEDQWHEREKMFRPIDL